MSVWSLQINGDEIWHTFVVQYTMLVFGNFPGNMLILEIDILLCLLLIYIFTWILMLILCYSNLHLCLVLWFSSPLLCSSQALYFFVWQSWQLTIYNGLFYIPICHCSHSKTCVSLLWLKVLEWTWHFFMEKKSAGHFTLFGSIDLIA